MALQSILKVIKTPFETLKNKKANNKTVINDLVTGIETPLDIITIIS